MKGQQVKKILQSSGYSLKDIAANMGETPQNFQSMLKVEDIKTGVLERIANAINKDITFFFAKSPQDFGELKVINDIIQAQEQIHFIYQKIVDVDILIRDYLKVKKDKYDYIGDAAAILNSMTWDKNLIPQIEENSEDPDDIDVKFTSWKDFDLEKKKNYNTEIHEALKNLEKIFFKRFRVLYAEMRGFKY